MVYRGVLWCVVMCAVLAGCGPQDARSLTALPMPPGPIGFSCPQGVKQSTSDGAVVVWTGVDPTYKDVCTGRNASGETVQRVRGIVFVGSVAPASLPDVQRAMAELTTRSPGALISVETRERTALNPDVNSGLFKHEFHVAGLETISTAAGVFHTVVIQDDYTSANSGGTFSAFYFGNRYWLDQASGILVRRQSQKAKNGISEWTTTAVAKAE